jgi:hypothetical protein
MHIDMLEDNTVNKYLACGVVVSELEPWKHTKIES